MLEEVKEDFLLQGAATNGTACGTAQTAVI